MYELIIQELDAHFWAVPILCKRWRAVGQVSTEHAVIFIRMAKALLGHTVQIFLLNNMF